MNYWLLKTEPSIYSFERLMRDRKTTWDGVKNPLALKNMAAMSKDDPVLIYHTGSVRAAVGLAKAGSSAYPDPKLQDPRRVVVDLVSDRPLARPVTLEELKKDGRFKSFDLLRLGRLSVLPVPLPLWNFMMALAAKNPLP